MPKIFAIILDILNFLLQTSTFPVTWKLSHVAPIPKSRYPSFLISDLSRYILRFLRSLKKFHILNLARILLYLEENDLLDPLQTGFRKGHSTQIALIKLIDDVGNAIDKRNII